MYISPSIKQALEAMLGSGLVDDWWTSANKAFDMKTPQQMYLEDPSRVKQYLLKHLQY